MSDIPRTVALCCYKHRAVVLERMRESESSGCMDFEYRYHHPQRGLRWLYTKGQLRADVIGETSSGEAAAAKKAVSRDHRDHGGAETRPSDQALSDQPGRHRNCIVPQYRTFFVPLCAPVHRANYKWF